MVSPTTRMKGEDLGQLTHPDLPGSFLVLALGTPSVPAKPKPLVTLVRQLVGSNWGQLYVENSQKKENV